MCIEYSGRKVAGTVMLASGNGRSLMLTFDAMLGGYVGMMPVLAEPPDDIFRDLVCKEPVTLSDIEVR